MATLSSAGRVWRRIAIALIILIVVVVAADRVGNYVAEQAAAKTIRNSQNLRSDPNVDIGGFPFLTQLASEDFDRITVTAGDVPVGDRGQLVVDRLQVVLNHVTVDRSFSRVKTQYATGTATIGYRQLGDALGIDVAYAGDGRVRASKQITVLGQTVTPTVTAAPVLLNGALSFGSAQINGLGSLAGSTADVLSKVFDVPLPLNGIPFQIRVQKLEVDSAGLEIRLAGSNLTYSGSTRG